jgi:predicted acylesterase/phospholipase RssA
MFLYALYQWIFKRLPRTFSILMSVFLVVYFTIAFHLLVHKLSPWIRESFETANRSAHSTPWLILDALIDIPVAVFTALSIIAIIIVGVTLSYWLAGFGYSLIRHHPIRKLRIRGPVLPELTARDPQSDPFKNFSSIGIILSGGGAKGAYQAGAMKAIYDFLEEHNAHHKVRMIAGSSIGSWNALFWLAGLIKAPNGQEAGLLEQWWSNVNIQSIIKPTFYLPFRRNHFLSNEPWQEAFDALFLKNPEVCARLLKHIQNPDGNGAIHFYFTRANVGNARLEFTTNRQDLSDIQGNLPKAYQQRKTIVPKNTYNLADSVKDIRTAVFSSMDLPPLFEYAKIKDDFYEDGGVIDNLPIQFGTEIEKCDLLFVLPLNANFDDEINLKSIFWRLFRVMNVRQGVLERNSFKMIYLFNELAALRDQAAKDRAQAQNAKRLESTLRTLNQLCETEEGTTVETLRQTIKESLLSAMPMEDPALQETEPDPGMAATRAQHRKHKLVQTFAICPGKKLIIDTAEFWKTKEAGQAFRLMHRATLSELEKFDFSSDPGWIKIAQVSSNGTVTYLVDF